MCIYDNDNSFDLFLVKISYVKILVKLIMFLLCEGDVVKGLLKYFL